MWTWVIDSVTKNPDGLTLTMIYTVTNGVATEQITEAHVPSDDACVQVCENAIRYRNNAEAQASDIAKLDPNTIEGDRETVMGVVFPPVDPDPVEVERAAWQQLLNDYQIALHGEQLGLQMAPPSAQVLSEIQETWINWSDNQQATFKPALLGVLL